MSSTKGIKKGKCYDIKKTHLNKDNSGDLTRLVLHQLDVLFLCTSNCFVSQVDSNGKPNEITEITDHEKDAQRFNTPDVRDEGEVTDGYEETGQEQDEEIKPKRRRKTPVRKRQTKRKTTQQSSTLCQDMTYHYRV